MIHLAKYFSSWLFLIACECDQKKIWERKKDEIKTTKKVFKFTDDWANLTANWAPMNDNAEDIKDNDQDV